MSEKLDKDEIYVPKECMVMAVSSNSYKKNAHPVLIWPTCSKSEVDIRMELIQTLSDGFYFKNNAPFMSWSTDGDETRRRIFDSLMRFEPYESSLIYPIISVLPLIDFCVGANEETVDFDIKHLATRVQNCFISGNFQIRDTFLNAKDIRYILSTSDVNTHGIDQLVNPIDKQNVPLATDFLLNLNDALGKDDLSPASFRVAAFAEELKMMRLIINGMLCLYAFVIDSSEDQLHTCYLLYTENTMESCFQISYIMIC